METSSPVLPSFRFGILWMALFFAEAGELESARPEAVTSTAAFEESAMNSLLDIFLCFFILVVFNDVIHTQVVKQVFGPLIRFRNVSLEMNVSGR